MFVCRKETKTCKIEERITEQKEKTETIKGIWSAVEYLQNKMNAITKAKIKGKKSIKNTVAITRKTIQIYD